MITTLLITVLATTANINTEPAAPTAESTLPDSPTPEQPVIDAELDAFTVNASQLSALEYILRLDREELAELRQTIDRIELLTEEQRQTLRERLRDFHRLSERDRRRFILDYRELSEEERGLLRAFWQNLSPEESRQLRGELRNLSPDERTAKRREMIQTARDLNLEPVEGPPPPRRLSETPRRPSPDQPTSPDQPPPGE